LLDAAPVLPDERMGPPVFRRWCLVTIGCLLFARLVASDDFSAQHCLMVGDDLQADVIGRCCALAGCLVQTGKYQQADQLRLPPQASA